MIESRAFNSWRSELLAEALTIQMGQQVEVEGDVSVSLGFPTRIVMTEVRIPSATMPQVDLAQLDTLSLEANPAELLQGVLDFDRLRVSGLIVHLIRTEDHRNNWSQDGQGGTQVSASQSSSTASDSDWYGMASDLVNFVRLRSEAFTSVQILFEDQGTNFLFDFNLEEMTFHRDATSQRLLVESKGSVNTSPFKFSGDYAQNGPFTTSIALAGTTFTYNGASKLDKERQISEAQLVFDTAEIGDLLKVLKLERSLEGHAELRAAIRHDGNMIDITDSTAEMVFKGGQRIAASGRIGDLKKLDDMEVEVRVQLYPDGRQPFQARKLSEIRVLGAEATLIGKNGKIFVDDATTHTNAFNYSLDEIGPISVDRIRRTDDGHLSLSDVSIQAGPPNRPILKATGSIEDFLAGRSFEFDGIFSAPMTLLFPGLDDVSGVQFGGVNAEFRVDDESGFPRLARFSAYNVASDLWSMTAEAQSGSDQSPKSLDLDLSVDIPDGVAFFRALGAKEADYSNFALTIAGQADQNGLASNIEATAGKSTLSTSLALTRQVDRTRLDGKVTSEDVLVDDLRRAVAGIVEFNRAFSRQEAEGSGAARDRNRVELQPLVLPKTEATLEEVLLDPDILPMVLPQEEITLEALLAEDGVEPLILSERDLSIKDMLDLKTLFLHTDVDVAIEIEKISGVHGVTRISSVLEATGGKASLGPVNFKYGGGFIDAEASMDLLNSPDKVRVKGSTGGWDIGKILASLGKDVTANGVLNGNFDLSGSQKSTGKFLNSMRGDVALRISSGSIATSLIELAGMGILPWLFSEERRQRYTRIECLEAPLRFDAGKVSFKNLVMETGKVQLVARGDMDWVRDAISVRAEPRAIGRPLSRSPWPITIAGRLSDPKFKLLIGGVRASRSDGATQMPSRRTRCVPDILQLQ